MKSSSVWKERDEDVRLLVNPNPSVNELEREKRSDLCGLFIVSKSTGGNETTNPTRTVLRLTLVVNGPTRRRFSRLAHSLPTRESERKKRNDEVSREWMCSGIIGRCECLCAFLLLLFSSFVLLAPSMVRPTASSSRRQRLSFSSSSTTTLVDGQRQESTST